MGLGVRAVVWDVGIGWRVATAILQHGFNVAGYPPRDMLGALEGWGAEVGDVVAEHGANPANIAVNTADMGMIVDVLCQRPIPLANGQIFEVPNRLSHIHPLNS